MRGNRRTRKSAKTSKAKNSISLLEREDSDTSLEYSRKRKNEKIYRPSTELSLSSLKEALFLIKTYKSSKLNSRQLMEENCQLAADKRVVEESTQLTTLYIEHNSLSYMKEIFLQSILKADFFTGVQVLFSLLEQENVSLLILSIYFKKAALIAYMYSNDISNLIEFFKNANLVRKTHSGDSCFKLLKKFLKLKPRKETLM